MGIGKNQWGVQLRRKLWAFISNNRNKITTQMLKKNMYTLNRGGSRHDYEDFEGDLFWNTNIIIQQCDENLTSQWTYVCTSASRLTKKIDALTYPASRAHKRLPSRNYEPSTRCLTHRGNILSQLNRAGWKSYSSIVKYYFFFCTFHACLLYETLHTVAANKKSWSIWQHKSALKWTV